MEPTPRQKAEILMETMPFIKAFQGKWIVIKYGGSAMTEPELKGLFAQNVVLLKLVGLRPVIVHGGGPQIGRVLTRLGVESRFVEGMRVTDQETMEVVEMVLGGTVNAEIVSLINRHGGRGVGLSGRDDRLIEAEKMILKQPGSGKEGGGSVDLGLVGRVRKVNPGLLLALEDYIPVIAPLGVGPDGRSYNINADLAAGRVAAALAAEKLILLTDVAGVLDSAGRLLSSLTMARAEELIEKGIAAGGMIPKIRCCLEALAGGVAKTHIIDGRQSHAVLLEVFTESGIGTEIVGADS